MNATSDDEQVLEFKRLLEATRTQLLYAHIHFDIWEQLWPTGENVDVINAYKGFSQPTRVAHLDRFFIKVSNIVSNHPKAPSFYRLLNMLDSAPNLAPSLDTRSLRIKLKKQKNLLSRIRKYRNKRAAHWDTEVDEVLDEVLVGESRELLGELKTIFNDIHRGHAGNEVWSFKLLEQSDTSRVLSSLS